MLAGSLKLQCIPALLLTLAMTANLLAADFSTKPAIQQQALEELAYLDISTAGDRLVAVGERGIIALSDDGGNSWQQARVPVSLTLTAVTFLTPEHGFAVGHEGIVLASSDGGAQWKIARTGRDTATQKLENLKKRLGTLEQQRAREAQPKLLESIELDIEYLTFRAEELQHVIDNGASDPLLDIVFSNANTGFILGSYGEFLYTRDGGQSWQSIAGRLDNPDQFHLYQLLALSEDHLLLVGESGYGAQSTDAGLSWKNLSLPYAGTLFGIQRVDNLLMAYGLRGNILASTNYGEQWKSLDNLYPYSLMASAGKNGNVIIVGAGGAILNGAPGKQDITLHPSRATLSGVVITPDDSLVISSLGGLIKLPMPTPAERK